MRSKEYISPTSEDLPDNINKDAEVAAGNFLYYMVSGGTNIRKTFREIPIIYATRKAAAIECNPPDAVISVAEYNRLYGDIMRL